MRLQSSRRTFLGTGAAFWAAGTVARAQTPSALATLRVASAPDEDALGTLWAQQTGIFKRYNLDVHLQASNSGAAVAAAVAGNAFDIGKSSILSLVSAHERGVPFVLVCGANEYDTRVVNGGFIVKKGSPIRSARDLAGKTISVSSLNDIFSVAIKAWTDQHGGDSRSLHFVELPNSAAPQAIVEARIDAAMVTNPIFAQAIDTGNVQLLGRPFDAIAKHFLAAGYFCTIDFAAKNRSAVDRFVHSIAEAAAYVNAHHAETVETVAAFTKIPAEIIAREARTTISASLEPRYIQPAIDAAFRYKVIETRFDARDLILAQPK